MPQTSQIKPPVRQYGAPVRQSVPSPGTVSTRAPLIGGAYGRSVGRAHRGQVERERTVLTVWFRLSGFAFPSRSSRQPFNQLNRLGMRKVASEARSEQPAVGRPILNQQFLN